MLPSGAISANRIWKRFRADKRRKLLRDEIQRLRSPNRRRGQWRWALRDVTFQAQPGEAIGLVGDNGSGKSTLLKILGRVMYPYAGHTEASGRIGALIDVKAGLHPELTGRENILLYGMLLGLSRNQISARFDEIVSFAELEEAIDRQLKFYSSGMQMRLGFTLSSFLEPDILLIDEVLAVGDAAFQHKSLERMRTLLNKGTSIVFVSHDLHAVEAVTSRAIWLADGVVQIDGPVQEALGAYRQAIEESEEASTRGEEVARLIKVGMAGQNGDGPKTQQALTIMLTIENNSSRAGRLYLGASEGPATPVFVIQHNLAIKAGQTEIRCCLPRLPLPGGRFYLWLGVLDSGGGDLLPWRPVTHFDVVGPDLEAPPRGIIRRGPIHVEAHWEHSPA
jgi:ABC-type polysaccharide/polyol phosphate transport system ATPase subunit